MSKAGTQAGRLSWVLLGLLCLYGLIHSALYALNNPVFESPDEPYHLTFVNWIAAGHWLPDQYNPKEQNLEGHQHPLYYVLAGEALRLAGGPISVNPPRSNLPGVAPQFDHGTNPFGSPRDGELFFTLRLVGAVMAGLTILQVGRAARKLLPLGHVWLLAPLLVATLPQVVFISGSISNDGLVILLSSCATYAAVCCAMESENRRHWIALGIWLGLALLTKKSMLAYLPAVIVLSAALLALRAGSAKVILKNASLALAISIVLFLPILVRNWMLYHELLGTQMEIATLPELARATSLDSPYFRVLFPDQVAKSFVAHFGWMSVPVDPGWVWWVVRAFLVAIGLSLLAIGDRVRASATAFCWVAFVGSVGGLVYYNLMFQQAQGRLVFPALAPIVLLCALGAHEITKRVPVSYKWVGLIAIAFALVWFDHVAYQTNQAYYDWYLWFANPGRQ